MEREKIHETKETNYVDVDILRAATNVWKTRRRELTKRKEKTSIANDIDIKIFLRACIDKCETREETRKKKMKRKNMYDTTKITSLTLVIYLCEPCNYRSI